MPKGKKKIEPNNDSKTKWCYTWNNYTEQDIEQMKLLTCVQHRCCKEVGDSGTPHLQGCIIFKRGYRFCQLKKLFPKVCWDGTKTVDPENYCIKGDVVINFDNRHQGKRSDLDAIADKLKEGTSLENIALEYPSQYIRYHKGIMAMQQAIAPKTTEFVKVAVTVVWGKPGCGKTRYAHANYKSLYNVPEPVNDKLWFDGYIGQEAILFDDFYGWVKYHTLLQLLDGYPMSLPVKGAYVQKGWKNVIITSNKHPSEWYDRREWDALKRRINEIKQLDGP